MNNRTKAYTEVYKILQNLDDEELKKIPPIVIKTIKNNMDKEYEFELDEDLELEKQPLLPQTKAILFNIFRDYLATSEQKQKIIRMQNEERQKLENAKREKYNVNVFENANNICRIPQNLNAFMNNQNISYMANQVKKQNQNIIQTNVNDKIRMYKNETQIQTKNKNQSKNVSLIKKEDNIFIRLLNKLKRLFKK